MVSRKALIASVAMSATALSGCGTFSISHGAAQTRDTDSPRSSPATSSPQQPSPQSSEPGQSDPPPSSSTVQLPEATSHDALKPATEDQEAPQDGRTCPREDKLYTDGGLLYMCTRYDDGQQIYEVVRSCADEVAADPKNTGKTGRREVWTVAPKYVTVYPQLPSSQLRYAAGIFQGPEDGLYASGTYIYPQGEKPSYHTAVPIPTYATPQANKNTQFDSFTKVCFEDEGDPAVTTGYRVSTRG